MVSMRDDVRLALIDNQVHFAIVGVNELTNDIPEYSYMPDSINTRARGLGGNPGLCAEESILCGPTDRWRGESICVHEFAHTMSLYGLYDADPTFEDRLIDAYQAARSAGLFTNTYAMENEQEYWGEGVQDWYYTNLESATPNGVHGPIDKREELQAYDPALYDLIGEWLSPNVSWDDCYRDG
jgi:alpha-glucosidase